MKYRNAKYNEFGGIDMEIEHPTLGWLPFSAIADDAEEYSRELFEKAKAGLEGGNE